MAVTHSCVAAWHTLSDEAYLPAAAHVHSHIQAMLLASCRNPEGAESGHKAFKAVTEAYECLKDPGKRASYDDLRQGLPQQADWASYSASARPGQSEDDAFDEMFRRFWAKHERE